MPATHGSGGLLLLMKTALPFLAKTVWPALLGGIPRRGMLHSALVNQQTMVKVASLVSSGELVPLNDSVFDMEDALAVSCSSSNRIEH